MMHLFYMLILCLGYVHGGNVLFFMPIIPKSNKMTWYPLAEEMAKRGHQVTTINPHKSTKVSTAQCLKITQNVSFDFLILAFSTNFCPIKTDLSGNTV